MQEQNFKKEVRQKMDELRLEPSTPVWQKVEEEIRKKKDRRRFVFWLLPLFILGGAAGRYFYFIPSLKKDTQLNSSVPEYHMPGVVNEKTAAQNVTVNEPTAVTGSITTKTAKENATTSSAKSWPQKKGNRFIKNYRKQEGAIASNKEQVAIVSYSIDNFISDVLPQATQPSTLLHITTTTDTVSISNKTTAAQKMDTQNLKQAVGAVQVTDSIIKIDSAQIKKHAKTSKQKWTWSVYTSIGESNTTTSLFSNHQADAVNFSTGQNSGPLTSNQPPSAVQKGIAYSIGVDAKRKLSERLSLTAGLHYSSYSTRLLVGAKSTNDTSLRLDQNKSIDINGYYKPGKQQELTNKYQFIDIPVGIEFRPIKKIPMYLNSGLTITQMIGSDAVVYDANSRIYYKSDRAFNMTGVYFFSSINYTFYKNKNFSVNAGPYLQYGLTKLENFGANKHRLYSAGIKINISF